MTEPYGAQGRGDMSGGYLTVAGGGDSGDVVGPASSTDNALARFDGTTGKPITAVQFFMEGDTIASGRITQYKRSHV